MAAATARLVRKHFVLSQANVAKLTRLSRRTGLPASEMLRRAIDSFDPELASAGDTAVLIRLARHSIRHTIDRMDQASASVQAALLRMEILEQEARTQ